MPAGLFQDFADRSLLIGLPRFATTARTRVWPARCLTHHNRLVHRDNAPHGGDNVVRKVGNSEIAREFQWYQAVSPGLAMDTYWRPMIQNREEIGVRNTESGRMRTP